MSSTFDHLQGKIILHAQLTAQEGQGDQVEESLKAIRDYAVSDKEPGCLTYRVSRSGNEFLVFEEYENAEAIKAHNEGPVFKALLARVGTGDFLVGAPKITFYQEV